MAWNDTVLIRNETTIFIIDQIETLIISIHTPKAGGTSILRTLESAFGERAVHRDYLDDPSDPASQQYADQEAWMGARPTTLAESISVVHGHFRPIKYAKFEDAFWMTFLRHPVDNIISIFNYWSSIPTQPHSLHQQFKNAPVDLLEFAKIDSLRYLYTRTYFGEWDMAKFDFVGAHENREADLDRLGKRLGVDFDPSIYVNPTTDWNPAEKPVVEAETMETLSTILSEDIALYEASALR